MIRPLFLILLFVAIHLHAGSISEKKVINYLEYVTSCADHLLEFGTDHYGSRKTAMWASIIDTRDYSVPEYGVPATKGVRSHDRAHGGSNLYQDVTTLKVFYALSDILNTDTYKDAANAYVTDYFKFAQSKYNGLLGWGEHLYYNFYADSVMIDQEKMENKGTRYFPHEFLGWTPPWKKLWNINPEKTKRAIRGLKYHYNGPDPKIYLFNRHANYFSTSHQKNIMPWIKHSALYAYSYAVLYNRTGNSNALYWSRHSGNLYWKLRDTETNLTLSCLFHHNASTGKTSSISGTSLLAYWLYKAYELTGEEKQKIKSLALFNALDEYHWNNEQQQYYASLNLDGTLHENSKISTAWKKGYGSSSILRFGRVAAYLAKKENNPHFILMAKRSVTMLNQETLPDEFTAQNIADVMNINLDFYDITKDNCYLQTVEKFAHIAVDQLWNNGLFARQNNHDPYYEAKLAVGDLLVAFLRLHLIYHPDNSKNIKYDWSF
ncbi:MAG: hypothetical protein U5R06_12325 [candidate division KSB1 bacterium]|nr:hypothetical protein [candidate division KSB1 bacterium]